MSGSESDVLVENDFVTRVRYQHSSEDVNVQNEKTTKNPENVPKFVYVLSFFASLGGFLFGYDTGVISGAMLLLVDEFHPSTFWQELIVSTTILFACIFSSLGGPLNDRLGRKCVIIISSNLFTVGAVVLCVAQNITMLIIGRAIWGIAIGFVSSTIPVYIAECSPACVRGLMVTFYNFFITFGQMVSAIVDGAFSYDTKHGWRYMFGLAALPSIIQFLGFLFLPESPRWLIMKNKSEAAAKALERLRGTKSVSEEIQVIQQTVKETDDNPGGGYVITKILRTTVARRALMLGCGIQLFQQLSGINTIMYYSATIIKMAGINKNSTAIWLAAATAAVNFLSGLCGLFLVERIGRRKLILGSAFGVLLSLIVLAVGFQLVSSTAPPVTLWNSSTNDSSCSSYRWCDNCVEDTNCGFCFTQDKHIILNGSCLPVKTDHTDCVRDPQLQNRIWANTFCPSKYSYIAFIGLVLYMMCFSAGYGPMPWTINSEIYPLWARSTGNAIATCTNWTFNLIVSMTFLTLARSITTYGTYWLIVGFVVCGIIFIATFLPETKGRTLEEMETLFEGSFFTGCPGSRNNENETSEHW